MSFDPYLPPSPEPEQTPGAPAETVSRARDRVQFPALLLMALGVFHIFVAFLPLWSVLQTALTPADRLYAEGGRFIDWLEQRIDRNHPMHKTVEDVRKDYAGKSPEDLKRQSLLQNSCSALSLLLAAALVIFGGWRMMRLKSYGAAVLASVVVAIPCISPASCCCIGEIVGLWSLWVLLTPDVRASFQ
jgi:hypothetical protein